jgi:hypothetical protein
MPRINGLLLTQKRLISIKNRHYVTILGIKEPKRTIFVGDVGVKALIRYTEILILSVVILVMASTPLVSSSRALERTVDPLEGILERSCAHYTVQKFYNQPHLESSAVNLTGWAKIDVLGRDGDFVKIRIRVTDGMFPLMIPRGIEVEGYLWIK